MHYAKAYSGYYSLYLFNCGAFAVIQAMLVTEVVKKQIITCSCFTKKKNYFSEKREIFIIKTVALMFTMSIDTTLFSSSLYMYIMSLKMFKFS